LNRPACIVVDASVSLKWALDDEDSVEEAIALRDDALRYQIPLLAPTLWLYEVTNGLVSAIRRRRISTDQGLLALEQLTSLGVGFADPEASDCYRAAVRHGVAAYDAAYLALAHDLGAVLWTGDRKFWDAVCAIAQNVRWIGDYPKV
jgi:predicted nucleic acid-binding protein